MSENTAHESHHGPKFYVKIWAILLLLLIVSVVGPELGIRWLTLVTAFGIAVVKAVIVASEFMHLKIEKRFISYMLVVMLLMVAVLFFGTAGDVMKVRGQNWENEAAQKLIDQHSGQTAVPAP